jgi:hypothetical protein
MFDIVVPQLIFNHIGNNDTGGHPRKSGQWTSLERLRRLGEWDRIRHGEYKNFAADGCWSTIANHGRIRIGCQDAPPAL